MPNRNTKYTIEEVRQAFSDVGYTLLSTEYVNCKTKLQYMCPNKHVREVTFDDFNNSKHMCPACQKTEKYSLEYVLKCFEECGYTLLETKYINHNQQLAFRCNNDHTTTISFKKFQQGRRCGKCRGRNLYTLQNVIDYFEEYGCRLITTEFIKMTQPLEYECSCGNINKVAFNQFRLGNKKCKKCNMCCHRHNIDDVRKLFETNGCVLLETNYVSNQTNMRYICNCGNEAKITYTNFRRGQRCISCKSKKVEETCLKHFGVRYSVQSPIVQEKMEKSGKHWKDYTMPSGKVIRIQGYENMGIDDLIRNGIQEDDIDVHCKTIKKEFMYHHDGLYRSYLPDFYIPGTNTIIEIKSDYIFMKERLQNIQKAKCCIALGYEFEFWIYNGKKAKTILKFDHRFTILKIV